MTHNLQQNKKNAIAFYQAAYVTMDFFRFDENGKIVEHWDSMQEIPGESENNNTMY